MKVLTFLIVLAGLYGCASRHKEKTGLEGKPLPSFSLFLSDSSTHFNTASIPSGEPIVLFFFGPYCPYSRAQMAEITANMKTFSNVRFYVFTTAQFPDMKSFYKDYELQKYSNVTVGIDYTDFFGTYFKATGVPYLAIYDGQKKLKEVLIGKSDASVLKQIAFE